MADKTGIEWTDATWGPTVGCSVVSPGCTTPPRRRRAQRDAGAAMTRYLVILRGLRGPERQIWHDDPPTQGQMRTLGVVSVEKLDDLTPGPGNREADPAPVRS